MFNKNSNQSKNIPIYGVIDERTKAIVYQGDAYTARFMLFAVLLDVIIRGLKLNDPITTSNWDLMLIVIIGGLISTAYQIKSKVIFNRPFSRSFLFIILFMGLCAIIAFLAAFFFTK
jgi:uncharacterized membrane protein AbrB (regulator of aidB expression)